MMRDVVGDNLATSSGGGIYFGFDSAPSTSVEHSAIFGNEAATGGGVFLPDGSLTRDLIYQNTATDFGGGVWTDAGELTNDTITGTGFATTPRATRVTFGTIHAPHVSCPTRQRCILRTPPHAAATTPVTVTVGGLTSGPSRHHSFTYNR
jgi:hypothetical protein